MPQLVPGAQVILVETANGWTLIVRDGNKLGYVEDKRLRGCSRPRPSALALHEMQKMQKLCGALDFAQFPQFLQTSDGVMLFPVPGCSRILQ